MLVAGAGAGSGYYVQTEYFGGYGGPVAGDGAGNDIAYINREKVNFTGKGATLTYPGKGGFYFPWDNGTFSNCTAEDGSSFTGGNGCASASASSGGGGSGYFGGGGGADIAGGGGGSSYASPKIGSVTLMNGNSYFAGPDSKPELGHKGNGCVIIEQSYDEYIIKYKCNLASNCGSSNYLTLRLLYSFAIFIRK